MSDPDIQEPLSTLSESSFVILGQGSLPPVGNDDRITNSDSLTRSKPSFNNYESTNSEKFQSRLWSRSSISEGDIQSKLDEVLKENSQLKETLNQNNLAIKSQLDTFIMWQQEVLKTHETHKQKFLETKDLILKLRAENMSLKRHLEEFPPTENGDGVYAQINKKHEDLDTLKQKIENYKQTCNDLNIRNDNLDAENQKLKEELRLAKNEVLKLNKELEDIGRENMFLKQKNETVGKNSIENLTFMSLPSAEAHIQISNLFEQLQQEKNKVVKLTKELEQTKSNNESETKLNTTDKLNQYIDKLNSMNDSFGRQSQRYSSLTSWVSLAEQNLKENKGAEANLVCEIEQLKSQLNQEGNVFREKQESLLELKTQFNKLLEDYKALQAKLTSLNNTDSNNEKHNEEVASLKSQLEDKDRDLKLKEQECDELKETIEKMNLECEEIELLRIQVKLYQNDFNEERAAREKLVGEKEQMAEQIRHLENRIQALERDGFNHEDSPLASPGRRTKYMCPRCSISFSDLKVCETHVEECLGQEFL